MRMVSVFLALHWFIAGHLPYEYTASHTDIVYCAAEIIHGPRSPTPSPLGAVDEIRAPVKLTSGSDRGYDIGDGEMMI